MAEPLSDQIVRKIGDVSELKIIPLLSERLGEKYRSLLTVQPDQATLFEHPEEATITLEEWNQRVRQLRVSERLALRQNLRDLASDLTRLVKESEPTTYDVAASRIPGQTMEAIEYLEDFFSASVRYLGPLRDEPKALYPLAGAVDPWDVGLKGENTAAVLDLHKNVRVRYMPTAQFSGPAVGKNSVVRTLQTAVLEWLRYMGVVEDLKTMDRGKLGHELKVTTIGVDTAHDLTHVGVGVSQVLPIVVMSLLAEPDSTLVFEQPELHLHPRVQTLLGDFFLSIALLGKQCIVETHSEYLINRLRFRVAAAQSEALEANIKMYFVEKIGDHSSFRPVVVNKYGAIQDWPEGFFDQSQREAEEILKAAMTKKRQERGARGNA